MSLPRDASEQGVHDAYLELGLALHRIGDHQEAAHILRRAARRYRTSAAAHLAFGLALLESGRRKAAATAFRQTIRNSEHGSREVRTAAYLNLGKIHRVEEDYGAAVAVYQKVLAYDQSNPQAWMLLGDSLIQLSRLDEAAMALDRSIRLDPANGEAHALLGVAQLMLERNEDAAVSFETSLVLNSSQVAFVGKAEALRRQGKFQEAIAVLKESAPLFPDSVVFPLNTARILSESGQVDEAAALYDELIRTDPGGAVTYMVQKAQALFEAGNRTKALEAVNHAITLQADSPHALVFRAWIHRSDENFLAALSDLDKAIALGFTPRSYVFCQRGEIKQLIGKYDEAISDFNEILVANGSEVTALSGRGETFRKMGRYELAFADFNQALELSPDDAWIIGSRGEAYLATGRYKEAKEDLNRAHALAPRYTWILAALAELKLAEGQFAEAEEDVENAIAVDRFNDRYVYLRALIKLAQGKANEARRDLSRATKLARDYRALHPDDKQNNFDMALYELARSECESALESYRAELDPESTAYVRNARTDVVKLSNLLPGHPGVQAVLDLLAASLE
jgi:tetratricopeptide (TPR) repeat protein